MTVDRLRPLLLALVVVAVLYSPMLVADIAWDDESLIPYWTPRGWGLAAVKGDLWPPEYTQINSEILSSSPRRTAGGSSESADTSPVPRSSNRPGVPPAGGSTLLSLVTEASTPSTRTA
jgi:hypothetical protein